MSERDSAPVVKVDFYESRRGDDGLETYRGLVSHALPGLHADVVRSLVQAGVRGEGARALDLGAGQGALSRRLVDAGFVVTACDYVSENFAARDPAIDFRQVDLNQDFGAALAELAPRVVCAVEIAEHLENPRHFLRQCRAALAPGGHLVVTTPNIDSPRSKVDFIVEGCFHMFRDSSYRSSGHIRPIAAWELRKMAGEIAMTVVSHDTFGVEDYRYAERPKAWLLQEFIRRFGIAPPWGQGAIHVLLLRKD